MVIMGSLMKETKEETISQLAARARAHVHIQICRTHMHALFWQFTTSFLRVQLSTLQDVGPLGAGETFIIYTYTNW